MSADDVVAELDRWLALRHGEPALYALLQATRDAALEEAARLCERVPGDPQHGDFFAAAIRALKDKGHD